MIRHVATLGLFGLAGLGCETTTRTMVPTPPTTTQSVTDTDPALSEPEYWLSQPARYSAANPSFDVLWDASDEVSRNLLFKIDRQDRRTGLLTTLPSISAQWFEPWRRELQTTKNLSDSSVATIRRTILYEFSKDGDGFVVKPKVLVERQAITERRVSGTLSRSYFRRDINSYGSREADQGEIIADSYWYPIGRDWALEERLVQKINDLIK